MSKKDITTTMIAARTLGKGCLCNGDKQKQLRDDSKRACRKAHRSHRREKRRERAGRHEDRDQIKLEGHTVSLWNWLTGIRVHLLL
jgi:hypothetical protein